MFNRKRNVKIHVRREENTISNPRSKNLSISLSIGCCIIEFGKHIVNEIIYKGNESKLKSNI